MIEQLSLLQKYEAFHQAVGDDDVQKVRDLWPFVSEDDTFVDMETQKKACLTMCEA